MPLYTYECPKGHIFEELGRFEDRETECPIFVDDTTGDPMIGDLHAGISPCGETAKRIPSMPAPAKFNCPMPTYQKPKEGTP